MAKIKLKRVSWIAQVLIIGLGLTLLLYGLRGFGLLGFLPGGIILGLMGANLLLGMLLLWEKSRRW